MMRFVKDYNKIEQERNMEFSLLVLLTVEFVLCVFGYFMDSSLNNTVVETFYTIWIFNLLVASLLNITTKPVIFSIYRAGFRMIYLAAVVYIFCSYGYMTVSAYVLVFCIADFVYLVNGVPNEQMTYPGKWLALVNRKWRISEKEADIEHARFDSPISDVEELKNLGDMEWDTSCDYFTADDDDFIFPHPPMKSSESVIV
ncbi:hypothetical protein GCK72_022905 [Caenorhabditis remanei]|uniref:Uncharacterized protein n=1 Tax=Caenorhabditis remanei TaxID=31234 RepID=A0A6A5FVG7_CAERE|nr:hypothetical protein GCK72_022905 [Caenorhabditis remanei]KAF1746449.1 hypothetical protein GCK72_022905 [Caenorhabditis remanei]